MALKHVTTRRKPYRSTESLRRAVKTNSRGLTSLAFAQLDPGRPRDPPYLHSLYILQIADVVRRVVFLLFLLCFQPIVRLFLPRETSEMFRHFVLTTKTTQPLPQVFTVNCSVFCDYAAQLTSFFTYSSKFGLKELVMMNYAWDFSQSETEIF